MGVIVEVGVIVVVGGCVGVIGVIGGVAGNAARPRYLTCFIATQVAKGRVVAKIIKEINEIFWLLVDDFQKPFFLLVGGDGFILILFDSVGFCDICILLIRIYLNGVSLPMVLSNCGCWMSRWWLESEFFK